MWVIKVEAIMETQSGRDSVELVEDEDVNVKVHFLQASPKDFQLQIAKKKAAKKVWGCFKTRFIGVDLRQGNMVTNTKKWVWFNANEERGDARWVCWKIEQYVCKIFQFRRNTWWCDNSEKNFLTPCQISITKSLRVSSNFLTSISCLSRRQSNI